MKYRNKLMPPLCCLNNALEQYICAIHKMVNAIEIHRNESGDDSALTEAVKNGVVPLLQAITDMERLLLRKFIFLLEHFQIDENEAAISIPSHRKINIMELNRRLNQICPNDEMIDETIQGMLQLDAQRKLVLESCFQYKRNNDPKTVWKPVSLE